MLNELFDLHTSMTRAGIPVPPVHQLYTECPPKKPTFKVLIRPDASIEDLEIIRDEERRASIYKYVARNQGYSFPAFSVVPLLQAADEDQREAVARLKHIITNKTGFDQNQFQVQLEHVWKTCGHLWLGRMTTRIEKSLRQHANELRKIGGVAPKEYESIEVLFDRAKLVDVERLATELKEIIARRIAQSPSSDTVKNWIDTLLVTTATRIDKNYALNVTLALELADYHKYKYPVLHPKTQEWVGMRLLENELAREKEGYSGEMDAFGQPITQKDYKEVYLSVRVAAFGGDIILRSMFEENKCQKRYGCIGSKSFAAGGPTQRQTGGALKWLGSLPQKDKTWVSVAGASGYRQAVLFAYPSHSPQNCSELAGLFGRDEVSDETPTNPDGAGFSAAAARVIPAIKGIAKEHPDTEIRIFVLAKPDKGRTKLLVSKHYDARLMIEAAQNWQDGCKNTPHVAIDVGLKDPITRFTPYPTEVVKCLNIAWLQEGKRVKPVHGLTMGEGIALLLEAGPQAHNAVQKSLQLVISNATPLLLALGHADHRSDGSFKWISGKDGTIKYAKHASLLPGVLGLLLHKMNCMKGEYMSSAAFLVGRMMSLADTLHKEYCKHERAKKAPTSEQDEKDGGMPRQLVGNASMSVALVNPTDALSRLADRILIYQAWANTASENKTGLARWALGEFGSVAEQLKAMTLPDTCDDASRAQMLLGYLARPEKK